MKLLVATNNRDKEREFRELFNFPGIELVFPHELGLGDFDVAETGVTYADNALLKAEAFARQTGMVAVADDSGLEIEALDGAPGVYSKRFAKDSLAANDKVLELLAGVENRRARFISVLVLFDPKDNSHHDFEGIFKGLIAEASVGKDGFGYDPIFIPEGQKETVAILGQEYKNCYSHRALALAKLVAYLKNI